MSEFIEQLKDGKHDPVPQIWANWHVVDDQVILEAGCEKYVKSDTWVPVEQ